MTAFQLYFLLFTDTSGILSLQQTEYAHKQWNSSRNALGMQKTLRNHMSHMTFKQAAK